MLRFGVIGCRLAMSGLAAVMFMPAGCMSEDEVQKELEREQPQEPVPGQPQDLVSALGLTDPAGPPDPSALQPAARIPRDKYGRSLDVKSLSFNLNSAERAAFLDGLEFFTTPHVAPEGAGPVANQPFCLGCHLSSSRDNAGSDVPVQFNSPFSRASRSGPTDFLIVAGTPEIGGIPPETPIHADVFGDTAAFTIFGDFDPDTGEFLELQEFGGSVQHVRPSLPECKPDFILPVTMDPYLQGAAGPGNGMDDSELRRAVGERGAPPYVGRGLMEAIYAEDIRAGEDPADDDGHDSSLASPAETNPECNGDCISGRSNENTSNQAFIGGPPEVRLARFGLRAAGPTILQFVLGGANVELGFTTPFTPEEPGNPLNAGNPECVDLVPEPELDTQQVANLVTLLRLLGIPELDPCLLGTSDTCASGATRAGVERGAQLFGVDLEAFRSRLIPGRTPVGDPNAINQQDRMLNCVGCHIPIMRTGQSPATLGGRHLSNRWFPIFSDLLIHDMGEVTPERLASIPRPPYEVNGTYDISRNLADDALPNQALATGREWRTPPLMALGLMDGPFLHDSRVYRSWRSPLPASTVYTNASAGTNVRFTIDTFDDSLRAAIELHDLPPPDDAATPVNGGCPAPFWEPEDEVCPLLDDADRSEARNVMQRWRSLSAADQQAVLDFLQAL
jgi:hypothetical protein